MVAADGHHRRALREQGVDAVIVRAIAHASERRVPSRRARWKALVAVDELTVSPQALVRPSRHPRRDADQLGAQEVKDRTSPPL